MAEPSEIVDSGSGQANPEPTEDMELETAPKVETGDETTGAKREREEDEEGKEENGGVSKKQKGEDEEGEKSVEEERLEKKGIEKESENGSGRVKLGPKEFVSSVEMFDYFVKFLHFWPTDLDVNKYEHMVLLDLIRKGHAEPDRKIGEGIKAFQIRNHPMWKSRCFFLVREDDTVDDFSFRKCVDQILPLPENMKAPKSGGGRGGSGGGKGRRGRGRDGKFRN